MYLNNLPDYTKKTPFNKVVSVFEYQNNLYLIILFILLALISDRPS